MNMINQWLPAILMVKTAGGRGVGEGGGGGGGAVAPPLLKAGGGAS